MSSTESPGYLRGRIRELGARPWWQWAPVLGALVGLVLHCWLLAGAEGGLLQRRPLGDFYDAQVRAWFAGRWDVPPEVAQLEGIVRDDRTYIYFGVLPSVLRVPLLAVTSRFDGRLTQLSQLGATAVATAAVVALWWRIRGRDGGPRDHLVAAAIAFCVPVGTTLGYLASRPGVYHEASAWGVALTLVTFVALVDLVERWRPAGVVAVAAAAAAAVSSRPSVGLGAIAAVALVGVWMRDRVRMLALFAAAGAALASYIAVVYVRFRTFVSIPLEDMVFALVDPDRREFLERHEGFFGIEFVPTTLVQYWRPNGVDITRTFPFVEFPEPPGPTIGSTEFDLIDHVASIPATVPALVVLAALGVVALTRRWRSPDVLAVITLGAVAGIGGIHAFGYIAHRYTADALPLLVVPALVGLARLRDVRAAVGIGVLVLAGIWVNLGLGLTYQRLWSPDTSPSAIARFIELRLDVADVVGGRPIGALAAGRELPTEGRRGDLAAIVEPTGGCAGLYLHDGLPTNSLEPTPWVPVERTEGVGVVRVELRVDERPPGTVVALATVGDPAAPDSVVSLRYLSNGEVRFAYTGDPFPVEGPVLASITGGRHDVEIALDRRLGLVAVELGGRSVLSGFHQAPSDRIEVTAPTARFVPGPPARLCERLLDEFGPR